MTLDHSGAWFDASPSEIAAVASADAFRGGPVGSDPVRATLYLEARQFMHGACTLLASHLQESRGHPVVLIQGRPRGQGWMTRHAMACAYGEVDAARAIDAGRGHELPVLDAAGGGTAGLRMPLYRHDGWDMRVILGRDPRCASSWLWEPRPDRLPAAQEGAIARLPALAYALGVPFDIREALRDILKDCRTIPREIDDSGLLDVLGMDEMPVLAC